MTIHPLYARQDTTRADAATAYDSIWADAAVPQKPPVGLERVMLAQDKLYVVLAVVLIIWAGIAFFLLRTDRRLAALERTVEAGIPQESRDE
jgi:CcmD family protein